MSANQAKIWAILGATGSGKSVSVKFTALRKRPRRLLVWDFKHEYGDFGTVTGSIVEACDLTTGKTFAVVFQPAMDSKRRAVQFDQFCRLAYALGDLTFVVEELAFVTQPSWAPDAWKMMTCTGRHQGIFIIGTSQRPAQIDKDFLGNATMIQCGRLQHKADVRAICDLLFLQPADIVTLGNLEYWQRDAGAGAAKRGTVRLP